MENRISVVFTPEELQQFDTLLNSLQQLLAGKLISLTPEENQVYGKLGNETENFVHMIHADTAMAEDIIPSFVNKEEWNKDVATRLALSPRITRFKHILQQLEDTNRLIGFDIYKTSLAVYQNAKLMSVQNFNSARTYYDKWRVQFPNNTKKPKAKPEKVEE